MCWQLLLLGGCTLSLHIKFYVLATLAAWGLHALPPYKILCVGKSCQHIKDLLVPAYYTSIHHGGRGRTLPAQYLLTNRQQPGLTYVDVRLHATRLLSLAQP